MTNEVTHCIYECQTFHIKLGAQNGFIVFRSFHECIYTAHHWLHVLKINYLVTMTFFLKTNTDSVKTFIVANSPAKSCPLINGEHVILHFNVITVRLVKKQNMYV